MQQTICKDECLNKDYKIGYKEDLHKSNLIYDLFFFFFFDIIFEL